MSFEWPWALLALALIPLLLAFAWWMRRRRRRAVFRVSSIARVRSALPRRSRWRRIPIALLLVGFLVLSVGVARPQATVPVASNSTTILLALDVSGSMCATDVEPNRITVAQKAAEEFISSQSGGTRIGLVAFSGVAALLVPPTDDKDELLEAVKGLTTSRGTAIGQAILASIDAIADVDPAVAPTGADVESDGSTGPVADAIVVLTDGANTQGVSPETAAEEAAARNLRVFTIGFGTTTPTQMVCANSQIGGGFNGFGGPGGGGGPGGVNPLVIDEQALQDVASTTDAKYFRAENAAQLQDALSALPKTITTTTEDIDIAAWFAAAGLLLVAGAVGLSMWLNRARRRRSDEGVAG